LFGGREFEKISRLFSVLSSQLLKVIFGRELSLDDGSFKKNREFPAIKI